MHLFLVRTCLPASSAVAEMRTMAGCSDHTFTFVLKNGVVEKDGVVSGTELSADGLVVADTAIQPERNFSPVDPLTFLSKSITTSNTDPCGSNTVTVSFSPDQNIYANCVSSITVLGLSGSKATTGSGPLVYGSGVDSNIFSTSSTWSETDDSITIGIDSDIVKTVIFSFSFDLINSHSPQNAITDAEIQLGALSMPTGEGVFSSDSVMQIDVRHASSRFSCIPPHWI